MSIQPINTNVPQYLSTNTAAAQSQNQALYRIGTPGNLPNYNSLLGAQNGGIQGSNILETLTQLVSGLVSLIQSLGEKLGLGAGGITAHSSDQSALYSAGILQSPQTLPAQSGAVDLSSQAYLKGAEAAPEKGAGKSKDSGSSIKSFFGDLFSKTISKGMESVGSYLKSGASSVIDWIGNLF